MPSASNIVCTSSLSLGSSLRWSIRNGNPVVFAISFPRYFFLTLPGGGSLMIAQNAPSSLMALTNSWKSTGFTT